MRWTRLPQTGSCPTERSSHSMTVVDDKLLLFGGEHDPRIPIGCDLYEYSFVDGSWRVLQAHGEPPSPRVAHSAAAVGSVLYIFGGRSGLAMGEGANNDLYAFDVTTAIWRRLDPQGSVPPKRSYHTMTALGTKLYVFGGCGEQGRLNDLHEYDTQTNTWTSLAEPAADKVPGRGGSCLIALPPGETSAESSSKLCVLAGFCGRELDDMHVYSVGDNTWCRDSCDSCVHSAPHGGAGKLSARSVFGAGLHLCRVSDCAQQGMMLIYGGEVDPSDKGHDGAGDFCASLMAYKMGDRKGWQMIEASGDSPGPRGWFAAAVTSDGRLIVHGGLDGNNERLGDMYVLDVHAE